MRIQEGHFLKSALNLDLTLSNARSRQGDAARIFSFQSILILVILGTLDLRTITLYFYDWDLSILYFQTLYFYHIFMFLICSFYIQTQLKFFDVLIMYQ